MEQVLKPVMQVLDDAVEQGHVPGAVALVRRGDSVILDEAVGAAARQPIYRSMTRHTIFDLASLTKPLATTPVVLRLVDQGLLRLDSPVGDYLPELRDARHAAITVRHLLSHSSGLPAWYPVYSDASSRPALARVIARLPLSSLPGTQVEYSCLGFILLGIIAERLTDRRLDEVAAELVFNPLGLHHIGYRPSLPDEHYAWTERGNADEKLKVDRLGLVFDGWRTDFFPGSVHDGNAYYGLQGVSGNAGLFGTAREVAILGQMWLNGGEYHGQRVLTREISAEATRNQTAGLNEARGLGWQLNRSSGERSTKLLSSGSLLSARAFGHTGFTGTSIWIDPELDLIAVLLTNRVHPMVPDVDRITNLRAQFHDSLVSALVATTRSP